MAHEINEKILLKIEEIQDPAEKSAISDLLNPMKGLK